MSPPRFYVENLPQAGSVELSRSESQHASNVLRLSEGFPVELFDGVGGQAAAVLESVSKRAVTARLISEVLTARPSTDIRLAVSLPKGDRQKVLVDGLTQLGVSQLIPLITERGVAQPTENTIDRLRRGVIESCKQCGRNTLMKIAPPSRLNDLAIDEKLHGARRLVAHPYGSPMALHRAIAGEPPQTLIAIGPEGGFTEEEVAALSDSDWQPVTLGPQILRIEIAALAVASLCRLTTSSA